MKTKHCMYCEHIGQLHYTGECLKGHKPRFYMPRNNDPYDDGYGYKKKCADFKSRFKNTEKQQ